MAEWPKEIRVGRETLAGRTTEMFLTHPEREADEFTEVRTYVPAPDEGEVTVSLSREQTLVALDAVDCELASVELAPARQAELEALGKELEAALSNGEKD